MDSDVMATLGIQWCDDQADRLSIEFADLLRQKTEQELGGVPPSVARLIWNRVIGRLFSENNLPEDLYEQTLAQNRDQRVFSDYDAFARAEISGQLLALAEDLRTWSPHPKRAEAVARDHGLPEEQLF